MPPIVKKLQRHSFATALRAAHQHQVSSRKHQCTRTGTWLVSGNGQTAARSVAAFGVETGTDVLHLNALVCPDIETQFGTPERDEFKLVIIRLATVVATASDIDRPIVVTATPQITEIPAGRGNLISDFEGFAFAGNFLTDSLDVTIIVKTWLDGELVGAVPFHWMAQVEVGRLFSIGG